MGTSFGSASASGTIMLKTNRGYRIAGGLFLAIMLAAGAIIPVQLPMSRPGGIPPAKKQLTAPLTRALAVSAGKTWQTLFGA